MQPVVDIAKLLLAYYDGLLFWVKKHIFSTQFDMLLVLLVELASTSSTHILTASCAIEVPLSKRFVAVARQLGPRFSSLIISDQQVSLASSLATVLSGLRFIDKNFALDRSNTMCEEVCLLPQFICHYFLV